MRMRKFLLHVKNGFFMIAMFVALAGGLSLASCSGDTPGNEDDGELTDGTGGGGGRGRYSGTSVLQSGYLRGSLDIVSGFG